MTIVCEEARQVNQRFYLRNPLVVNGLQTSMVIHTHFSGDSARRGRPGLLLVRVIQTTDSTARDRVIRSTNSQTSVPAASLRATDTVQRDIEQFFLHHGWYYDRRKSYYKNQGKPADRIISIPYLAQSLMAIGRRQPDDARARPSSLLKDDDRYAEIFDPNLDLEIYLWAAKTQRAADAFLRTDRAAASTSERTNLRFHLSMLTAARANGRPVSRPSELRPLVDTTLSDDDFAAALEVLRESLAEYQTENDLPIEQIAKSREFVTHLVTGHFDEQPGSDRATAAASVDS